MISKEVGSSEIAGFGVQRHMPPQLGKEETALVHISSPSIFQFAAWWALFVYTWGYREARIDNSDGEELQTPDHVVKSHLPF